MIRFYKLEALCDHERIDNCFYYVQLNCLQQDLKTYFFISFFFYLLDSAV